MSWEPRCAGVWTRMYPCGTSSSARRSAHGTKCVCRNQYPWNPAYIRYAKVPRTDKANFAPGPHQKDPGTKYKPYCLLSRILPHILWRLISNFYPAVRKYPATGCCPQNGFLLQFSVLFAYLNQGIQNTTRKFLLEKC